MTCSPTIGRRSFLFGAVALSSAVAADVGVVAPPSPAAASAVTTTAAWKLKATHWSTPRGDPLRTHCKCSACVHHADNKIFATLHAAENPHLRAHPGCLCEPKRIELPSTVWKALFADASIVDRRDPGVAAILAAGDTTPSKDNSPPARVPSRVPARVPSSVPTSVPAGSAGSRTHSAGSNPGDVSWLELPILGLAAGLGFLVWWRHRHESQESESEPSDLEL